MVILGSNRHNAETPVHYQCYKRFLNVYKIIGTKSKFQILIVPSFFSVQNYVVLEKKIANKSACYNRNITNSVILI